VQEWSICQTKADQKMATILAPSKLQTMMAEVKKNNQIKNQRQHHIDHNSRITEEDSIHTVTSKGWLA
jgi:hypothetical protein